MFHSEIINDSNELNAEVESYNQIPRVADMTTQQVLDNFYQVKMEVKMLIISEAERLKSMNTTPLTKLVFGGSR